MVLDDTFKQRIHEIVLEEKRPFSYNDFKTMSYGTFRNKISDGKKVKFIEVAYYEGSKAYYTLSGIAFDKPKSMTDNYAVLDSCHPIQEILENMSMGQVAVHDIRLAFVAHGIWEYLYNHGYQQIVHAQNKDMPFPPWDIDGLTIRLKIHHTDTVSIAVACSEGPIAANIQGLIKLTNALTRIEERLSQILNGCYLDMNIAKSILIPSHREWIVKMWHIGRDSIDEYDKEKFHCSWELAEGTLARIYSKEFKNHDIRVREEIQCYPNKRLDDVVEVFLEELFPNGELIADCFT